MEAQSSEAPLNIWSNSAEELGRSLSNFAHTPFQLDGVEYASVEAFYACLLIADPQRRDRVRKMYGVRAKHEIPKIKPPMLVYLNVRIRPGSAEHYSLIKSALRAKLRAHPEIAQAFALTRPRRIEHETGHPDAPNAEFPKEVFCRLLEELREEFAAQLGSQNQSSTRLCTGE
jgi:hypothetical protein